MKSQNNTCATAMDLCNTNTITQTPVLPFSYNVTAAGGTGPFSCTILRDRPTLFYRARITRAGTFTFLMTSNPQIDYDWALWVNPDCNNLQTTPADRHSFDLLATQTGMNLTGTFTCENSTGRFNGLVNPTRSILSPVNVNIGDVVIIAVNSFGPVAQLSINVCGANGGGGNAEFTCEGGNNDCPDECYWKLDGNSIASVNNMNNRIGTIPPIALRMITNNIEQMRITNTGDVGIGTIQPSQRLDVNGQVRVRNLPTTASSSLVAADVNGVLQSIPFSPNPTDVLRGNGTWGPASNNSAWNLTGNIGIVAPTVPIGTQITTGNYIGTQNIAPLVLATQRLERMRITDGGNVGIGIIPNTLFEANRNGNNYKFSEGFANQTPNISVINSNPNAKATSLLCGANGSAVVFDNSGYFSIGSEPKANFTNNSLGGTTNLLMTVLPNGNVGIGTTNPSNNGGWNRVLDVYGQNHSKILSTVGPVNGQIINGVFSHLNLGGMGPSGMFGTETNHPIFFTTNNAAKMILNTGGDIGLGRFDPTARLSVQLNSNDGNASIADFRRVGTDANGFGLKFNMINGFGSFNNLSRPGDFGMIFDLDNVPTVDHAARGLLIAPWSTNTAAGLKIMENGNTGVGHINPRNKLEITKTANIVNGQFVYPNTGESGLRFTNLRSNASMIANPGSGVLSVDEDGDVIYVENQSIGARNGLQVEAGFAELGRECGSTSQAANLTNSRELPMSNFNFVFSEGGNGSSIPTQNRVGIGSFGNDCSLNAKLHVNRIGNNGTEWQRIGVLSEMSESGGEFGSFAYDGINNAVNPTGGNTGMRLNVTNALNSIGTRINVTNTPGGQWGPSLSIGSLISVNGADESIGVDASASCSQEGTVSIGGAFNSAGGLVVNRAVSATAHPDMANSTQDIAVFAELFTFNGAPIGPNDWALFADGPTFTPGGVWTASDKNLKKDIQPIENALSTLGKLEPKKYDFDNEKIKALNLPSSKDNYGFIAQELENVLPSLVRETDIPRRSKDDKELGKIKVVNYTELIPIAISAIKELNAKVEKQNNAVIENEALKSEIASLKSDNEMMKEKFALLEKTITQLCESGCEGLKKSGEGSSSGVDVLYQSIPNPTDSEALINYSLSKEYTNAFITVSTQEGKTLLTVKLDTKKGAGSIKLSLGEFSNGTYLYTLVAGEQVVDTKRLQIVK